MKTVRRKFTPGSEWLFLKIYLSTNNSEKILENVIIPLVKTMKSKKYIDKWFFIKYQDPDYHLRVRLHLVSLSNIGIILRTFNSHLNKYVKCSIISKLVLDTYCREIERYKPELMAFAEDLFYIDSEMSCKIFKIIKDHNSQELERLLIGVKIVDSYLSLFGFELNFKREFALYSDHMYKKEFHFTSLKNSGIDEMYRRIMPQLTSFLIHQEIIDDNNYNDTIDGVLSEFKERSFVLITKLNKEQRALIDYGVLGSYIHMSLNRLFKSNNRMYEMLVYNYITRIYTSRIAIVNKK